MKFKLNEATNKDQQAKQMIQNSYQILENSKPEVIDFLLSVDFNYSNLQAIRDDRKDFDYVYGYFMDMVNDYIDMVTSYNRLISNNESEYFDDILDGEKYFKQHLKKLKDRIGSKTSDIDIQYSDDDWSEFQ